MPLPFRIGNGFDVHRLVEGRPCIICGVDIPYEKGLLGHSDADVALHALSDAILGAAALRDIGYHFPDTDPRYSGADSRLLLRQCLRLVGEKGYAVANVDITVIAQAPKMLPYIEQMRANVAQDLRIPIDCVSVKATTTEHLGFTGRSEGIASLATALLTPAIDQTPAWCPSARAPFPHFPSSPSSHPLHWHLRIHGAANSLLSLASPPGLRCRPLCR